MANTKTTSLTDGMKPGMNETLRTAADLEQHSITIVGQQSSPEARSKWEQATE